MKPEPPQWHPYDPEDPPPDIPLRPETSLVVLLVAGQARQAGWAPRAAVALARSWAEAGRRIFLADLGLSRPELHVQLAQENGEGVADLFLYGASLGRVGRPHAEGFFFAPAGTPVARSERVLSSPRWAALTQGFARANAHFLCYLPDDEPGHEELLSRADEVVVLAAPGRPSAGALGSDGQRVAAVLWPTQTASRQPAAAETGEGAGDAVAAEPDTPPPPPARPASAGPAASRGQAPRSRLWILVLLAVALVVAVLMVLGVIPAPWGAAMGGLGEETLTSTLLPPEATTAGAYSLTLGSYREGAVARLQAEALGRARPDLLFVVAPVEVEGEVFHRLLVGPTDDSLAGGLKEALAPTLSEEDPAAWVVRETPLAFHLGAFLSLAEARSRADELSGSGIPAYVLHDVGSTATPFHVWAGAYEDSTEAAYLARVLDVDATRGSLQRRRGQPPA